MKQVWQLFGWSVILLIGLFLSQDMCLWLAPAILHFPSIAVLFAGTFVIFVFLAAVPLGCFYAVRSVWRWRDRRAAVSDFLYAGVCLLFAIGYVGNSIWAVHDAQQHSLEHQRMVLRSLRRWRSTTLITGIIPIRYRD
jgi:hypothetical protein